MINDHMDCNHTYEAWYWCYECRVWYIGHQAATRHEQANKHRAKLATTRRNLVCEMQLPVEMGSEIGETHDGPG